MLGVTASAMATAAGAEVVVADPDPVRLAPAARFGAVDGQPAREAYDAALELSGHPAAVAQCVEALRIGGRAVLAGSVSAGPPVGIDPERAVRGPLTSTGVHNYRPADLVGGVAFLAEHHQRYPFADLVGPGHPLDRIDAAFTSDQRGVLRQAVVP
ncbi:zinc-binding dehydrogenase [Kibdelosporangium phytohabitans]|uniref:Alcohol dehydrogenase-like C-terminal domain-containing protein n=1 Tax=Kibdelosporangium phytohabitans TaxID=860235 RepID=A0A0N9IBB2_9PSEU|nr:zinc-binding dehydrogenase [Kibdelosporangium phytohabitans]ALG11974.1 hypothetical protein AOZ06_38465 [Kibdelosporangium phytohabitans]MBE1463439.1 threonine dehydrogenase-like Zn-dependent dehydrogenase [Kibdelosporangium phytohabitans]